MQIVSGPAPAKQIECTAYCDNSRHDFSVDAGLFCLIFLSSVCFMSMSSLGMSQCSCSVLVQQEEHFDL